MSTEQPTDKLTTAPQQNDIYDNGRGTKYRVLYIDQDNPVVLLRSEQTGRDGKHSHLIESPANMQQSRWSRVDDPDVEIPKATPQSSDEQSNPPHDTPMVKGSSAESTSNGRSDTEAGSSAQLDAFAASGTETAESGSEADSDVSSDTTPNDDQEASSDDAAATDTSEGQADTPAWNDVTGIGDGTAEKLIERGFDSHTAVREATDEELAAVPNIGSKTIEHLRGYVE